jgi:hypothetical protein
MVLTSLRLQTFQTANHTAALEDSLDVYKLTGFTAHSTTNTVTPVISKKRTSMAAAGCTARGLTVAGNSSGMTGGTQTKESVALAQYPNWYQATIPTSGLNMPQPFEAVLDKIGEHPYVFAQDEGVLVELRVAFGAAGTASVYVDASWAELSVF